MRCRLLGLCLLAVSASFLFEVVSSSTQSLVRISVEFRGKKDHLAFDQTAHLTGWTIKDEIKKVFALSNMEAITVKSAKFGERCMPLLNTHAVSSLDLGALEKAAGEGPLQLALYTDDACHTRLAPTALDLTGISADGSSPSSPTSASSPIHLGGSSPVAASSPPKTGGGFGGGPNKFRPKALAALAISPRSDSGTPRAGDTPRIGTPTALASPGGGGGAGGGGGGGGKGLGLFGKQPRLKLSLSPTSGASSPVAASASASGLGGLKLGGLKLGLSIATTSPTAASSPRTFGGGGGAKKKSGDPRDSDPNYGKNPDMCWDEAKPDEDDKTVKARQHDLKKITDDESAADLSPVVLAPELIKGDIHGAGASVHVTFKKTLSKGGGSNNQGVFLVTVASKGDWVLKLSVNRPNSRGDKARNIAREAVLQTMAATAAPERVPALLGAGLLFDWEPNNFLLMELMNYADNLQADAAKKYPNFGTHEYVSVAASLVDTLEKVHALGIAHNDIFARNIFVTRDYKVKLFDWGEACLLFWDNMLPANDPRHLYSCHQFAKSLQSKQWAMMGVLNHATATDVMYALQYLNDLRKMASTMPADQTHYIDEALAKASSAHMELTTGPGLYDSMRAGHQAKTSCEELRHADGHLAAEIFAKARDLTARSTHILQELKSDLEKIANGGHGPVIPTHGTAAASSPHHAATSPHHHGPATGVEMHPGGGAAAVAAHGGAGGGGGGGVGSEKHKHASLLEVNSGADVPSVRRRLARLGRN